MICSACKVLLGR